jgi:hypothetical protein
VPLEAPELQPPFRNSTVIVIVWKELTLDRARGFVTNYTISYKRENATAQKQADAMDGGTRVVPATTYQVILNNFDTKSPYSIIIWASTTAGKGKSSAPQYAYCK